MTNTDALKVWETYLKIRAARLRAALLHAYETEPTTEARFKGVVVELDYQKGGMNYANYKTEPRGYYVTVRPTEIERHEHGTMEKYGMFTGIKFLYEPAKAFGAKKLETLAARCAQDAEAQAKIEAYAAERGGIVDKGAIANLTWIVSAVPVDAAKEDA